MEETKKLNDLMSMANDMMDEIADKAIKDSKTKTGYEGVFNSYFWKDDKLKGQIEKTGQRLEKSDFYNNLTEDEQMMKRITEVGRFLDEGTPTLYNLENIKKHNKEGEDVLHLMFDEGLTEDLGAICYFIKERANYDVQKLDDLIKHFDDFISDTEKGSDEWHLFESGYKTIGGTQILNDVMRIHLESEVKKGRRSNDKPKKRHKKRR